MSYSVVLGTSDENLLRQLRSQLSELPDIHLAEVLRSSSEVTSHLSNAEAVDCLLLHESLGPLPILDLVREVSARQPYLAIVLIYADPRPDTLAAAMESGARGVVSTSPSLEDLENRIGNASAWSRLMRSHLDGYAHDPVSGSGRSGMLIALAGAKGGTGTTTTAIHLALAASTARRTVCLVDMDLQSGDLPTFLDITHRRSIVDLAEAAEDLTPTALADAMFTHKLGPHVLLAPRHGERADDISGRAARQILGSLRSRYDLVIVDCGAYTTEAGAMAAELADKVVVTTSPDLPSLRGTRRLVEMWERLQVRKKDDVQILLTRHSKNSEIQPDFARKVLRLGLLSTTLPASFRALEAATNTGMPGDVNDPAFRRAIGRLLRELGALHGTPSAASAPPPEPSKPARKKPPAKKRKPSKNKRAKDAGQTSVEFLGIMPLILGVVVILWEAVVLGMALQTAAHGANEGARSAAVGKSPEQVREDVRDRMTDAWAKRASIDYEQGDPNVTVSLNIPVLLPSVELPWKMSSTATVVDETGEVAP